MVMMTILAIKKSDLDGIVSLYDGDGFVSYHYDDMLGLDRTSTIDKSNSNLLFCMPTLTSNYANYDFAQAMAKGIQFVGMNFQNSDFQLQLYNKFFILKESNKTSPYIKKHDSFIEHYANLNFSFLIIMYSKK